MEFKINGTQFTLAQGMTIYDIVDSDIIYVAKEFKLSVWVSNLFCNYVLDSTFKGYLWLCAYKCYTSHSNICFEGLYGKTGRTLPPPSVTILCVKYWHKRRRCSWWPFRRSTVNDISEPLFSPFFSLPLLFFFFFVITFYYRTAPWIKKHIWQKLPGSLKNLGGTFPSRP